MRVHPSLICVSVLVFALGSACTSGGTRHRARDAGSHGDTGVSMPDGGAGDAGPPATCDNGMRDGDETHVDCGGSCSPCPDGAGCARPTDCMSMVCQGGFCLVASCTDGVLNGAETDADCGGATCPGCEAGLACAVATDCASGLCDAATSTCAATSCEDGVQNSDETDVDCGGATCPGCPGDGVCNTDEDCASRICVGGRCTTPSCDDRVQNGDETDVDCGGSCMGCRDSSMCLASSDCSSMQCQAGVCISCMDARQNGDETDVDCGGGTCDGCGDTFACLVDTDCSSSVCTAGACAAPACDDMVRNGDETDVDCGGSCTGCADGGMCTVGADCDNSVCTMGTCQAPTCMDGVANGTETDVDCGGPGACMRCTDFRRCTMPSDCTSAACTMGFCGSTGCIPFPGTSTDTFGYFGCSLPLTPTTLPCPDIKATGTGTSLGDDGTIVVSVGFTFDYYGTGYTQLRISANGAVTFGAPSPPYISFSNRCMPASSPATFIGVFWDDLYPGRTGAGVWYQTLGTAPNRTFVVDWDVPHISSSLTRGEFRLVLHETSNDIKVCYVDTDFGSASYNQGRSATAGIQGSTAAGNSLQFSCNAASLPDGLLLQYFHP